jgi:hypothetical protein
MVAILEPPGGRPELIRQPKPTAHALAGRSEVGHSMHAHLSDSHRAAWPVDNGEKLRLRWTAVSEFCIQIPVRKTSQETCNSFGFAGPLAGREFAMEPVVPLLIVSFFDPVRALITFGCAFLSRKYGVLVAALTSSLVCETILAAAQGWRYWGQGILPGFIASLLQAALLLPVIRLVRRRVWRHAN